MIWGKQERQLRRQLIEARLELDRVRHLRTEALASNKIATDVGELCELAFRTGEPQQSYVNGSLRGWEGPVEAQRGSKMTATLDIDPAGWVGRIVITFDPKTGYVTTRAEPNMAAMAGKVWAAR